MNLTCHVGARRRSLGLTATALALEVGISRQALAAIEAERSVPSTSVALALAHALGCRVEDLFVRPAAHLAVDTDARPGQRVTLGRVRGRWVGHAVEPSSSASADGVVVGPGQVELLGEPDPLTGTVLVSGCAPVLGVLSSQLRGREGGVGWVHRTSSEALEDLARGRCHVAGLHLAAADEPQVHDRLVRERVPGVALTVVGLVGWREGLAVASGNPLGIGDAADLARPGTRVGQRAAGSGAAAVLMAALGQAGLGLADLQTRPVRSHLDAASAIRHGAVDAAVVIEPVAHALGLGFLPLSEERFELVLRTEDHGHPGVQRLLDRLASARFLREVRAMGPYDAALAGDARRLEAS